MTNKRKEQFEADRIKMLNTIGNSPEESLIPTKNENKSGIPTNEEIIAEGLNYNDVLKRIREDREAKEAALDTRSEFQKELDEIKKNSSSPEEAVEKMLDFTYEDGKFEQSLVGKSDEEIKAARKLRKNKIKRTKERQTNERQTCSFGIFTEFLDEFQAKSGGGFLLGVLNVFVLFPVVLHWYTKGSWLLGLIVLVFGFITVRIAAFWLSLFARILVKIVTGIGPQFIAEVKEGNPALKCSVSLVNKTYWCFSQMYLLVCIVVTGFCLYAFPWNKEVWIDSYFRMLVLNVFITGAVWFSHSIIGFAIYVGFIRKILSGNKNAQYRLRYRHDQDRILIPTRKCNGSFVSRSEMIKATAR